MARGGLGEGVGGGVQVEAAQQAVAHLALRLQPAVERDVQGRAVGQAQFAGNDAGQSGLAAARLAGDEEVRAEREAVSQGRRLGGGARIDVQDQAGGGAHIDDDEVA
jgi:hypothetical protein